MDNIGDSIHKNENKNMVSPSRVQENANGQTLDKTIDIQVKNINGNDARIFVGDALKSPEEIE